MTGTLTLRRLRHPGLEWDSGGHFRLKRAQRRGEGLRLPGPWAQRPRPGEPSSGPSAPAAVTPGPRRSPSAHLPPPPPPGATVPKPAQDGMSLPEKKPPSFQDALS